MIFDQLFIGFSVALFLAALAWGAVIGQILAQRSLQSQRGGTWRTVVYSNVDITKAVSFIYEKEDQGLKFLSDTRADGARFGTFYFAKQIA